MSSNLDRTVRVIKLTQNENAFGTSPKALKAIEEHYRDAFRYPDVFHTALKQKLADHHQIAPEEIVVAAGSIELMDICIKTFVEGENNIVTAEITFEGYRYLARTNRKVCRLAPLTGHRIDLGKMLQRCDDMTRIIFIANPNNPTGTMVTHSEMEAFLQALPPTCCVVSDEAYSQYVTSEEFPNTLVLRKTFPNLIIFHTFSKIYGLAGLRIGYAIARPELIERIMKFRTPFSINSLALAAATAALDDADYLAQCAAVNEVERRYLYQELERLGFNVTESQGNFLFIDFDSADEKERMYECLKSEGVFIRRLESFGAELGLRITVGRPEQNRVVVEVLTRCYR